MIWRRKQEPAADATSKVPSARVVAKSSEMSSLLPQSVHAPAPEQGMLDVRNTDRFMGAPQASASYFQAQPEMATNQRGYVVPRGYKVSGSLFCVRPVFINGEVQGRELVAGVVTVMPGGGLYGQSRVGMLLAAGLVDGHVQADQLVEVSSQGEIRGEVRAPAIQVQPGARLSGASLQIGAR